MGDSANDVVARGHSTPPKLERVRSLRKRADTLCCRFFKFMKKSSLRWAQWAWLPLALVLIHGCGSSQSRYLAPEYEEASFPGGRLVILPLSSELLPDSGEHPGATVGTQDTHFNREGRELFYELFGRQLQNVAAAQVASLGPDFEVGTAFRRQRLPMGSSDTLAIPVPEASVSNARSSDFVLLVDELRFRSVSKQVREGAMGSAKRRTEIHLIATCQYLLWDNERARPAAYGRFKDDTRVRSPTSQTHYSNLYESLADHVIERSPIPISHSGGAARAR